MMQPADLRNGDDLARCVAAMFVYDERDRIAELRNPPANRPGKPLEGWFDGAALGGFGPSGHGAVVPQDHGLRALVDAPELPR